MSTTDPQLGSASGAPLPGEAPAGAMSLTPPPRWAWWMLLVAGLCSVVIGVLLLAWPNETLVIIAQITGIYLLVIGALWVAVDLKFGEASGGGPLRGILALLAGVIVIRHPSNSLTLIALAIGICLLLAGVIGLARALASREHRGLRILLGVVDLAIGVLIVSWPQFGVTSIAVVLGISLIVRGVLEAGLGALALVSLRRTAA